MNKLTKLMKLKVFLWIVVYAYLFYAIAVDGPSAGLLGLLAAAVVVCVMQIWMHSKARTRWMHNKFDKKSPETLLNRLTLWRLWSTLRTVQ